MVRALSIGIDILSSVIFIIPAVLILQYVLFKQHNRNKTLMVFVFACYFMAVCSVTGIPSVWSMQADFRFNIIPLIDIRNDPAGYIKNTILNIALFLPLGFLLPAIWNEYRFAKKTICMGLFVSIGIELLQIFTYRLTDVDDLITNTLGTILGFYIAKMVSFKLPLKLPEPDKTLSRKAEPAVILTVVFLITFFLKSPVSNALWDFVMASPLWETIK